MIKLADDVHITHAQHMKKKSGINSNIQLSNTAELDAANYHGAVSRVRYHLTE